MKNHKSILRLLGLVLMFVVAATAGDTPSLTFKFTRVKVPGSYGTTVTGVNDAGVMVGHYCCGQNKVRSFILKGKHVTTIAHAHSMSTEFGHVNYNGSVAVVGRWIDRNNVQTGFLYKNGKFTRIPGPTGATLTIPAGINDAGNIAGSYADSSGTVHGFILKGATYTTLDVPGAAETFASGINNHGDVVLFWLDSAGRNESSLYNGKYKTYKTINVPGAQNSEASDLDNAGDVVYRFDDSSGNHGALLRKGKYYRFDYPKAVLTWGSGINDKHTIVGYYEATAGGPVVGFKATYK